MKAAGVQFPVVMDMLIDGKSMRDQARVCRGLEIPKEKKGATCNVGSN